MIRSINSLTSKSLQADLCIVGGGAAGITLAVELAGTGVDVLLIESGGTKPDPPTQALYEGSANGINPSYLRTSRLRFFGGTTNHWTGYCRPLDKSDFHSWPISYEELSPYYRKAAELIDIFDPTDPDKVLEHFKSHQEKPLLIDSESFRTHVFHQRPVSFNSLFRTKIDEASNIRVITEANLTSINLDSTEQIKEIEARSLSGKSLTIRAYNYALCCGGLENPRILLNSEIAQIDRSGKLGVGFSEHPFGISADMVLPDQLTKSFNLDYWASHARSSEGFNEPVKLVIGPKENELTNSWPNFYLMLDRKADSLPLKDGIISLVGGSKTHFQITAVLEQQLEDSNKVSLSDETDILGLRKIHVDWNYSEQDRVKELLTRFAQEMGWTFNGRLRRRPFNDHFLANHHIGTTRMGSSSDDSVVDIHGRFHTLNNLYLCGSSVFPKAGASNPTLTIMALSIRMADHFKSQAGSF